MRMFVLDRIKMVKITDERFTPPKIAICDLETRTKYKISPVCLY